MPDGRTGSEFARPNARQDDGSTSDWEWNRRQRTDVSPSWRRCGVWYGDVIAPVPKEWLVTDTVLDGTGESMPGRHPLDGTDLEIAYTLLGDDLALRVNKGGVQVFRTCRP
jgi:hypothetical protein